LADIGLLKMKSVPPSEDTWLYGERNHGKVDPEISKEWFRNVVDIHVGFYAWRGRYYDELMAPAPVKPAPESDHEWDAPGEREVSVSDGEGTGTGSRSRKGSFRKMRNGRMAR
jgi:hypothetical protein